MSDTLTQMRARLVALSPQQLSIEDESAQHAGHAGAKGGGGHYRVYIVSDAFAGKGTLARHRLVYDTLGELMQQRIHALSIVARTVTEHSA